MSPKVLQTSFRLILVGIFATATSIFSISLAEQLKRELRMQAVGEKSVETLFDLERFKTEYGFEPFVYGGTKARSEDWPATFVFDGSSPCTSTAIGPFVVLTAAHCVPNEASAIVEIDAKSVSVKCDHHESYPATASADFALCKVGGSRPIQLGTFETLNKDQDLLASGKVVRLLGYGCIEHNSGVILMDSLYQGDAVIQSLPRSGLFTRTTGGPAVCAGDSGGAAYIYSQDSGISKRIVIGVASRGDQGANSWIATVSEPLFRAWAEKWASENNVSICGVAGDTNYCRRL